MNANRPPLVFAPGACPHAGARQQGAVLVIGLILLVLLTLMGLTTMRTTSMEERMASQSQDSRTALEAAEAAMRRAEADIDANPAGVPIGTYHTTLDASGYYLPRQYVAGAASNPGTGSNGEACNAAACRPWWEVIDWTSANSALANVTLSNAAQASPRYIVESIPVTSAGCTAAPNQPVSPLCPPPVYRITVRAVGMQLSDAGLPISSVMLQRYHQH